MKTLKTQYIILTLIACYFLMNVFIPRDNEILSAKVSYLMNEGWQPKAAEHIAKVELKLIPEDALYIAYMED
jgi:hypothetical protein